MSKFPIIVPAIKVNQPFREFYICALRASDLLNVTFSDVLRYNEDGSLTGGQRYLDEKKRVQEIADYVNGDNTAMPNSIILAVNYTEDGFIEDDDEYRWRIEEEEGSGLINLVIPTGKKLAAIVDGQHRLRGFENAISERRNEMELLVSVYFDIESPYQAYIFTTINYNQKPVNKSLALEQYGYFAETENPREWSPEVLAVSLAKRLNLNVDSPFYNRIKLNALNGIAILELDQKSLDWIVANATIVDGILRLITTNPKRDSNELRRMPKSERSRLNIQRTDNSILRGNYLQEQDLFIYKVVENFFNAVINSLFKLDNTKTNYIKKTVGIQALFFVLREILEKKFQQDKDVSVTYFQNYVNKIVDINFSDNFFTASGLGRSRISNTILIQLGFKEIKDIGNMNDQREYSRILNK